MPLPKWILSPPWQEIWRSRPSDARSGEPTKPNAIPIYPYGSWIDSDSDGFIDGCGLLILDGLIHIKIWYDQVSS